MIDNQEEKTVVLTSSEREALRQRVQQVKCRSRNRMMSLVLALIVLIVVLVSFLFRPQPSTRPSQHQLTIKQQITDALKKSYAGCTEIPLGKSTDQLLWENPMVQALVNKRYLNMLHSDQSLYLSMTNLGKRKLQPISDHRVRFCYAQAQLKKYSILHSSKNTVEVSYSYGLTPLESWLQAPMSTMGPTEVTGNHITLARKTD